MGLLELFCHVDDFCQRVEPKLEAQRLFGKLFGDKGYVSQSMMQHLLEHGVQLITRLKSNMKNRLLPLHDQLKNISQIEHSRHRSPLNFCVNLLCGLIAYSHQPKKPSLRLDLPQLEAFSYP